jgi:hypothetical protein
VPFFSYQYEDGQKLILFIELLVRIVWLDLHITESLGIDLRLFIRPQSQNNDVDYLLFKITLKTLSDS